MRTTFSHAILALRLALCLALAACAKSNEALPPRPQAEPSPFESASALQRFGGGICAEGRSTEVAIDEVTDAGFAAEELLAFIEGEHREKMRWSAAEGANISPESGEVELIIVVERASERAFAFDPDTDAIGHGARCWPWLLVDVVVTVQSPGGALNERFEAQLYSADLRVAYLAATTPSLELAGALAVTRAAGDFVASSYELRMSFSEHGVTGSLLSNWSREVQEPRLYWEETIELASWGRAHCDASSAYSVGLDDSVELGTGDVSGSGRQAVELIDRARTISIQWEGGGTTSGTLRFSTEGAGACVVAAELAAEPYQDLFVPGELELQTEDGRVDARWQGRVRLSPSDAFMGAGVTFSIDAQAMPDGETATPEELGFPGEQRGDFTSLWVGCDLGFQAGAEDSGSIQLSGFAESSSCDPAVDADCLPPGTITPLVRGTLLP